MSVRQRSPEAQPAPGSPLQSGGPGPAKRRRLEELAGSATRAVPVPGDAAGSSDSPAPASTSGLILTAGCVLQLPVEGGYHLLLEPLPGAALQVTIQDDALVLIAQDLLGSRDQCSGGRSFEVLDALPALLGPALESPVVAFVEQQGFCATVPDIARQEEVQACDYSHPVFPAPDVDSPAAFPAGPLLRPLAPINPLKSGSPGFPDQEYLHLLRSFPTSPLQPLPPFATPWPHQRPAGLPGPHRKARRRLFQT
ncbi:proline-rich protein 23A-like [Cavia porcellus]|uniref:proline-rich protein 23A-like n=1 Tax=Cavia porcellus TaxID=10141 RepID=UPI002FE415D9